MHIIFAADNFFFQEERRKIIFEEEPRCDAQNGPREKRKREENFDGGQKKKKNKVSFQELGRMIGKRWMNVKSEHLEEFAKLAKEDAKRYKEEMNEFYKKTIAAICCGNSSSETDTLPGFHGIGGIGSQIDGSIYVENKERGKVESNEASTLDTQYLGKFGRPFPSQTGSQNENTGSLQLSLPCPDGSSAVERVLPSLVLHHNRNKLLQQLAMQNHQQQLQVLALMQRHQKNIAMEDQKKLQMFALAQSNQLCYPVSVPSSVTPCLNSIPRLYLDWVPGVLPAQPLVSYSQAVDHAFIQSSLQQSARRAHHTQHQNGSLLGTLKTTNLLTAPLVPSADQTAIPVNCTSLEE